MMNIQLVEGTGAGPTLLAAFDAALVAAGIGNYNLLRLSSVIPAGSRLEDLDRHIQADQDYGARLYVVMASQTAVERGHEAWAGLGWVQDEAGRGLFVEIHGASETQVRDEIDQTLEAMRGSRQLAYGPVNRKIAGIRCVEQPVCAVVVAVYQCESWNASPVGPAPLANQPTLL